MLKPEEILHEYPVTGMQVLTPHGYIDVVTVYKTIPLQVWYVQTETFALYCAGHHLVKCWGGCAPVSTLIAGERIQTSQGWEVLVKVEMTDRVESLYDLTVDCPTGLYYADGICSHNSTTFVARQRMNSEVIPGYKSLYVVPYPEQLKTYARRYAEMEPQFRFPDTAQNVYNKIYKNGSAVDLVYCLSTADKSRGKSVDEVLFDEAQNMDPDLVPEISYVQTMSKIPTTIYAGTALSVDTLLDAKWRESSMGVWHIKSGDGKRWLNMYDKDTLFAVCDNPRGPTCPYTGKLLDVTKGGYVHMFPEKLATGQVGIHVPQCIIPDLAYDPIKWGAIYQKVKQQDPKKTLQECFGIAVAEGSREISLSDLMRLCVLQETPEQLKRKAHDSYYRLIISGCDWGGSDYNQAIKSKTSYTVHTILGLAPDGGIDILHWKRYAGMDYMQVATDIVHNHKAWNAQALASDFGAGAVYNMELRNRLPMERHFIMGYVGPLSAPLSIPKGDHMANQLSLNRTEAISAVFKAVKQPSLKIRCREWEHMSSFLLDWLNLYRVPSENANGMSTFKYIRSASKADDALHAFTFAYILMLWYLGEPIVSDENLAMRLRDALYGRPVSSVERDDLLHPMYTSYVISG